MSNMQTTGNTRAKTGAGRLFKDQRFILGFFILFFIVVISLINSNFVWIDNSVNLDTLVAILTQICTVGIMTMGMALLLISGGIDLSIGANMVLSAVIMAKILMGGGPLWLALTAGMGSATVLGFVNGVIIAKTRCVPLIISLGMNSIFYGISLLISDGKFMNFKDQFEWLRTAKIGPLPILMLAFFFIVVFATYLILNRTKFGRRLVAIGGNEENAYLSGISVDWHKIVAYTISGFFCGIASLIFAARLNSVTSSAVTAGYELSALTAAVIGGVTFEGGRGTILGAFLGVLMIGLIQVGMDFLSINTAWQKIVIGVLIVGAVVLSNISKMRRK